MARSEVGTRIGGTCRRTVLNRRRDEGNEEQGGNKGRKIARASHQATQPSSQSQSKSECKIYKSKKGGSQRQKIAVVM